jgi:hypothetical protein
MTEDDTLSRSETFVDLMAGVTVTRAERIERRIHKRASRFNSHGGPILH